MNILRAVADGARLSILRHLEAGELCACKLPSLTRKSQPNVSKHLRILHEAGLVTVREDGRSRIYSLSKKGRKVVSDVSKW